MGPLDRSKLGKVVGIYKIKLMILAVLTNVFQSPRSTGSTPPSKRIFCDLKTPLKIE
jgi:hypothetical protein